MKRAALIATLLAQAAPAAAGSSDSHLGVPDAIWLPINLAVFLYLLYRFVGKPMASFLDGRRAGIGAELAQATERIKEAERLRREISERLANVERDVIDLRERAERAGAAEADAIEARGREEEERFLRRVDEELVRRSLESRQRLAEETATLTAELARELLEHEMTDADRRRVLDRSLAALRALDGKG